MDLGFVVIWSALGTFQEGQMSFCLSYAYVSEEHDKKKSWEEFVGMFGPENK